MFLPLYVLLSPLYFLWSLLAQHITPAGSSGRDLVAVPAAAIYNLQDLRSLGDVSLSQLQDFNSGRTAAAEGEHSSRYAKQPQDQV
jgi:hypothetical protein